MNDPPEPPSPAEPLSGDRQEEFIRLLSGTHGLLLRYVLSLVGNRHDAEDVVQRTGLTMWRRFASFEPGSDFIAWATTVAFYEVRNFQRATGRSRLTFDDGLLQLLASERAIQIRDAHPRRDALDACIEKLDGAARRLIDAVYVEGTEVAAFAARQGQAVQTIYNRLSFIRRALADCVRRRMAEASP
jgi:RNA polymerase sigma-70 factor, ECF subfamily